MKLKYEIGQMAYLKTDPNQNEFIVTGILYRDGSVQYELSYVLETTWHYAFEMSGVRDIVKATSN